MTATLHLRRTMTTVPVEVAGEFVSFCVNTLGLEVQIEGVSIYDTKRMRVSFPPDTPSEDLTATWDMFKS